jgi:hypothetical protein
VSSAGCARSSHSRRSTRPTSTSTRRTPSANPNPNPNQS